MVLLHLPRLRFSILTSSHSLSTHSNPFTAHKFPTKNTFFFHTCTVSSAPKSALTTTEPIPISHFPETPVESHVEFPLEKLFVPPETDVSCDSATLSTRILKGSNIVLSKYARDAQVLQAEFVKSSVRTEDCPSDGLPEFALVGRSNVGKSSLLNSLVRRKKLALTSKKPGEW